MENWKFINNSDWQISDLGNVKKPTGKLINFKTKNYRQFTYIDHNNLSHSVFVHRMVALYFCNPPEGTHLNGICEGYNIHRKNIIKYDNRAESLVYITIEEHQQIHKELRKNQPKKEEPKEKTWRDYIFENY